MRNHTHQDTETTQLQMAAKSCWPHVWNQTEGNGPSVEDTNPADDHLLFRALEYLFFNSSFTQTLWFQKTPICPAGWATFYSMSSGQETQSTFILTLTVPDLTFFPETVSFTLYFLIIFLNI